MVIHCFQKMWTVNHIFLIWKYLEAKIPCRTQNFMLRMHALLKKFGKEKIHYWDFVYLKQKYLIIKSHFHNFYNNV